MYSTYIYEYSSSVRLDSTVSLAENVFGGRVVMVWVAFYGAGGRGGHSEHR